MKPNLYHVNWALLNYTYITNGSLLSPTWKKKANAEPMVYASQLKIPDNDYNLSAIEEACDEEELQAIVFYITYVCFFSVL